MSTTSDRSTYLNWLEDECFFSVCSRQHIFWANYSPRETLAFLFNPGINSYSHDFPRNLDSLNPNAVAAWGSVEDIINQHTIAPIFFPFQSLENALAHKEAMKGENLGSIKYKLGLITSRYGGEHPLKACNECILDDRATHGIAYWHRTHQFPGVTICEKHGCLLKEAKENRQWSRTFSWFIPSEDILIEDEPCAIEDSAFEALKSISTAAIKLGELGPWTRFEPGLVAQVYESTLARMGTSRLEKMAAAEDLAQHCSKLRMHPQFWPLPSSSLCAIAFTSQMTRKPRGYCHPLKHLVLISWLFQSIECFVSAYQHQARLTDEARFCEPQDAKVTKVKSSKITTTLVPPLVFKPKKIFKEVKKKILASLATGTSKVAVCTSFGISISTVNRMLRLNPTIKSMRIELTSLNEHERHKRQWYLTLAEHPNFSTNQIRKLIPNIYAWLYRNDKPWLTEQSLKLPNGRSGNNSSTDWASRDENLCAKIKDAMRRRTQDSIPLRKSDFYQLIPGLHPALQNRAHYYKTRALLAEIQKSIAR